MPNSIEELLLLALDESEGRLLIGEILIGSDYTLRHHEDEGRVGLNLYHDPEEARRLARFDAMGGFRCLRSAPTLRRGWMMQVGSLKSMILALDEFYPSALGLWLSAWRGTLAPTPLRETLGRQSGMFRVTQMLRDDQAAVLISSRCGQGCLRTICWDPGDGVALDFFPTDRLRHDLLLPGRIPLLCRETCNLLVSDARPIAKTNLPPDYHHST